MLAEAFAPCACRAFTIGTNSCHLTASVVRYQAIEPFFNLCQLFTVPRLACRWTCLFWSLARKSPLSIRPPSTSRSPRPSRSRSPATRTGSGGKATSPISRTCCQVSKQLRCDVLWAHWLITLLTTWCFLETNKKLIGGPCIQSMTLAALGVARDFVT